MSEEHTSSPWRKLSGEELWSPADNHGRNSCVDHLRSCVRGLWLLGQQTTSLAASNIATLSNISIGWKSNRVSLD